MSSFLCLPAGESSRAEGIQAPTSASTSTSNRDRCSRTGKEICSCQKAAAEKKAGIQRTWPSTQSPSMRLSDRDADGNLIEKGPRISDEVIGNGRGGWLMTLQEAKPAAEKWRSFRKKSVDSIDWAYPSRAQSQERERNWQGEWAEGRDLELERELEGLTPVCSAGRSSVKDVEEPLLECCEKAFAELDVGGKDAVGDGEKGGVGRTGSVKEDCGKGWKRFFSARSRAKRDARNS